MGYIVNERLEAILDSDEYDSVGETYLSHVRQDSTGLKLIFDIRSSIDSIEDSTWLVKADNVYCSSIWSTVYSRNPATFRAVDTGLEFTNDHPVIHRYTRPSSNLSVRGRPDNVGQLLLELAKVHVRLHSPYMENPFASPQAIDVLLAGYGIVASGPTVILDTYIEVLAAHGVACHINTGSEEQIPQAVGLLMDRGFVVSQFMWAEQIL